jgi:hypothetical protein
MVRGLQREGFDVTRAKRYPHSSRKEAYSEFWRKEALNLAGGRLSRR